MLNSKVGDVKFMILKAFYAFALMYFTLCPGAATAQGFSPEVASLLNSLSRVAMVEYRATGFQELLPTVEGKGNQFAQTVKPESLGESISGEFLFDRTSYRVSGKNVKHFGGVMIREFRFDGDNTRYILGEDSRRILGDLPPSLIGAVDIGATLGDRVAEFLTMKRNMSFESLLAEAPWEFFPASCELRMKSNWPNKEEAHNEISFFLSKDNGFLPEKITRTLVVAGKRYLKAELKIVSFFRANRGVIVPSEFIQIYQDSPVSIRAKLDRASIKVYDKTDSSRFTFSGDEDSDSSWSDRRTSTIVAKNNQLRAERLQRESKILPPESSSDPWLLTKILVVLGFIGGVVYIAVRRRAGVALILAGLLFSIGCNPIDTTRAFEGDHELLSFSIKEGHEFQIVCSPPLTENHEIRVRNVSRRSLRITEIVTSCGCVDATFDDKVIIPKQESRLRLNLRAPGVAEGPKAVAIKICFESEGRNHEKTLQISTVATSDWRPTQSELVFTGKVGERSYGVLQCIHEPGAIISVLRSNPELTETSLTKDGTKFKFAAPIDCVGDSFIGEVVLQSKELNPGKLSIPCRMQGKSCLAWNERLMQISGKETVGMKTSIPSDVQVLGIDAPEFISCQYSIQESETGGLLVMTATGISEGIGKVKLRMVQGEVKFSENVMVVVRN